MSGKPWVRCPCTIMAPESYQVLKVVLDHSTAIYFNIFKALFICEVYSDFTSPHCAFLSYACTIFIACCITPVSLLHLINGNLLGVVSFKTQCQVHCRYRGKLHILLSPRIFQSDDGLGHLSINCPLILSLQVYLFVG